ncbi:hypothetical protein ACSCB1_44770 [Streptomyces europaeiscabiei]|uniref:hypothetical protein n=1 Tax=Streptomyces europaeiscabiei TaxID=146819 RepID=UPI000AE1D5E9|nr:hypothetical protein [Streptomyces europaeiscabiei]MDX2762990.1 hypothetical protein [Streptomyces europaeiscabiei]MDX3670190.1 hypothetical protein [Streptomyces europaeiscabiei]MDX3782212.1 hypothetical protein [Streptomyces europaeiscabiei]MDX3833949.1 hypothetical protein [Streptomyces europaeiscabiei]MDX3844813.1 hypothetical protein [Streptomyces europaeiscabiei]
MSTSRRPTSPDTPDASSPVPAAVGHRLDFWNPRTAESGPHPVEDTPRTPDRISG